jgi:hypothetical protein
MWFEHFDVPYIAKTFAKTGPLMMAMYHKTVFGEEGGNNKYYFRRKHILLNLLYINATGCFSTTLWILLTLKSNISLWTLSENYYRVMQIKM